MVVETDFMGLPEASRAPLMAVVARRAESDLRTGEAMACRDGWEWFGQRLRERALAHLESPPSFELFWASQNEAIARGESSWLVLVDDGTTLLAFFDDRFGLSDGRGGLEDIGPDFVLLWDGSAWRGQFLSVVLDPLGPELEAVAAGMLSGRSRRPHPHAAVVRDPT